MPRLFPTPWRLPAAAAAALAATTLLLLMASLKQPQGQAARDGPTDGVSSLPVAVQALQLGHRRSLSTAMGGGTGGGGGSAAASTDTQQVAEAEPAHKKARRLPSDKDLERLETALGYNFTDKFLPRLALIHPSYGEWNNARLTWLGDSVLGTIVSDLLYQALPDASTAELHEARKARVRREACAEAGRKLGLHKLLVVGKGYEGEEPTTHMLAEGFEAIWGAIYQDQKYHLGPVKRVYAALHPVAADESDTPEDQDGTA